MYPRFVIKDFGSGPKAVDRLLKHLLPAAKVVFERQESDKERARVASELRDKRQALQKRKKVNEANESKKYLMKGVEVEY
jgi:hypothetical protein